MRFYIKENEMNGKGETKIVLNMRIIKLINRIAERIQWHIGSLTIVIKGFYEEVAAKSERVSTIYMYYTVCGKKWLF